MFCPGCLSRFVTDLAVAARIAQAFQAAWLAGNVYNAFVHAHNFALVWRLVTDATKETCR